jgi:hypothetical protein
VSEGERKDGLVLVAIVGGVAGLVLWRGGWLSDLPHLWRALLDLLHAHPALAIWPLPAALGLLLLRALLIRRTLRSRLRFLALPAESFDPSPQAVVRFAAQLGRLRRSVGGFIDAPALGLRVLLVQDEDGRLRYLYEVPGRARALLRSAARLYDEVELTELQPVREDHDPAKRSRAPRVARAELVLAHGWREPLGRIGLDPDPLQALAGAFAELDPRDGERATVAIDVLPVGPARRRRLARRLLRNGNVERRFGAGGGQPLADLLVGRRGPGRTRPGELVARRVKLRGLEAKLAPGEPLLSLQLLIRAEAPSAPRAKLVLGALLAAFDAFAAENHLRASGLRLGGLAFLGSDLPGRRWWFDLRLRSGLHRPARRGLVTPSEIAGLLKPPGARCHAANVERSAGAIPPPPPGLPAFDGQRELVPLGRLGDGRTVAARLEETFFSYCAGRSRYGKTETAIGQFVHLARSGHGGLFLDPHADAIAEIKAYLTDPAVAERVVAIDVSEGGRGGAQPGWNPFDLRERPAEVGARVEAVVDALAAALGWDERNTRALNLSTQAAQALCELALVLPAELQPTLFQIPTLLSNPDWREVALPHLSAATRQFFQDRFPRLPAEAITPVTNLIDRLRAARSVAALLGQPRSTYRAAEAMDKGLVVLACPGSGSTRDRLVANLLVYDVLHAARQRARIPAERRRPFFVFLDELQTYDGPNLPALLEQSAKYGGRAFLFNQNPERLTDATWNAVSTNRSHLMATALNARAASLIAREWGARPGPEVITQLPRYSFLCSATLGARTTRPFLVHGAPARELHAGAYHPDRVQELERKVDATAGRRPVAQVLSELDRHDQRIAEHLARLEPPHTRTDAADPEPRPGRAQQPFATRQTRQEQPT